MSGLEEALVKIPIDGRTLRNNLRERLTDGSLLILLAFALVVIAARSGAL